MGRHRNNPKMKGKGEVSETKLNEKEASHLSDTEFKELVIRKLHELIQNYQKLQGNYKELTANYINMKKELQTINKGQEEMKNTISELKYTVEGMKSRLDEAEDQISELEDKVQKTTQKKQEKEKRLRKNEEELREIQDNMKWNNIHIIGIPEGEEEQGIQNLLEKVTMENFPNLMREKVTQIQESQRVPSKRNPKWPTATHIIIKMAKFKDKERILKAAKEKKEVTYKGAPISLPNDFSMEKLQARREWQKIFQVMRTRGLQPRLLYPARLSIKIEDQIKSFPDKRSLKEYTSTKPALQEMLKGLL